MRMEKVSQTSYYHLFDQIGSIHEGSEYMDSIQHRDKYNTIWNQQEQIEEIQGMSEIKSKRSHLCSDFIVMLPLNEDEELYSIK